MQRSGYIGVRPVRAVWRDKSVRTEADCGRDGMLWRRQAELIQNLRAYEKDLSSTGERKPRPGYHTA